MSEIKTNKISPRKGTTTTIGDSGDTVSLPSGTSLNIQGTYSGINSINWDTTAKTANFTAETNRGYFINTTSGEVTITLPATPVAGSFIGIKDYAGTAQTNNIVIGSNGNKIQGQVADFRITTQGGAVNLVYVDATQGWLTYDAAQASDITEVATFISATGGCITTCGDYKIHTFTGPGTFTVSSLGNGPTNPLGGPQNVDYLVVAGGGGGGSTNSGGGGGAGGYRTSYPTCGEALPISVTSYPIAVGGGGTPGSSFDNPSSPAQGGNGSNSIFSTITSTGGGGGAGYAAPGTGTSGNNTWTGNNGGSGGGGSNCGLGGTGNTPPVSPPQGNPGNPTGYPSSVKGGGGGGATASGGNAPPSGPAGPGGAGASNSITGTAITYAGGGGGGIATPAPGCSGAGGPGGGGAGGDEGDGVSGTANTGGGGGGSGRQCGVSNHNGGAGGSGIVIIRYKYQ